MNKLDSLDELILSAHEKVTRQANKSLGWTKYDLAKLSFKGCVGSSIGVGYFGFEMSRQTENYVFGALGLAYFSLFGIGIEIKSTWRHLDFSCDFYEI